MTAESANLVLNPLSTSFNSLIEGAAVGKDFSSVENISAPEASKPVNPATKFSLNTWILRRVPAMRRVRVLKFGELMSGRVGSVACGLRDGSVSRKSPIRDGTPSIGTAAISVIELPSGSKKS
jgi:hypothetical protein